MVIDREESLSHTYGNLLVEVRGALGPYNYPKEPVVLLIRGLREKCLALEKEVAYLNDLCYILEEETKSLGEEKP